MTSQNKIDNDNEREMKIELTNKLDNDLTESLFASKIYQYTSKFKPTEWITKNKESLKPWSEFVSFSKFSKPQGAAQCASRLKQNIDKFYGNYLVIFIILAVYCM